MVKSTIKEGKMIIKKTLATLLILTMLAGCGHPLDLNGKTYPTYGFVNENTSKSVDMCYEVSFGNIVWSIIGVENVIMPVYFIGWSLFNPVGPKINGQCQTIDSK
jgi:hypothetical protein